MHMPLQIIRQDITKIKCDAIVNAAKKTLLGGGGVDGAIHSAAGPQLLEECKTLGGCKTGQAKITKGYNLPCKYVIHTVGPVWKGGLLGEQKLLHSCYAESLHLAKQYNCKSIAFPLISSGAYGYPKHKAFQTAMDAVSNFLLENDMMVYIVVYDKSAFNISEKLFNDIKSFIDDKYVEDRSFCTRRRAPELNAPPMASISFDDTFENESFSAPDFEKSVCYSESVSVPLAKKCREDIQGSMSLEDVLGQIDESFSQMLLRKIDEKGITDAECYKKANIDRKLFSKIRNDVNYKPKKTTAIAFAIALELSLEETKDMLMKAGYALSHSNKFDIIIEYFIINRNYNIFEINEALFEFDQCLLGG